MGKVKNLLFSKCLTFQAYASAVLSVVVYFLHTPPDLGHSLTFLRFSKPQPLHSHRPVWNSGASSKLPFIFLAIKFCLDDRNAKDTILHRVRGLRPHTKRGEIGCLAATS